MSDSKTEDVRVRMKSFWEEFGEDPGENEMMLDTNAEELGREEIPELLGYLPDYTGKKVVELAAGIGRITSILADKAASVLAVDFTEGFIEKNKATNGHRDNVKCLCADVRDLNIEGNSTDLVFSNWMLMYLEEWEVENFLVKLLEWLVEDGYFFMRESCLYFSGNMDLTHNPTIYRPSRAYDDFIKSASLVTSDGIRYAFKVKLTKSLDTYKKYKNSEDQHVWLLQKVRMADNISR